MNIFFTRLLSMRMPNSNRTSSFSVRDILDLGPKQNKSENSSPDQETQITVNTTKLDKLDTKLDEKLDSTQIDERSVKTEHKPDIVKNTAPVSSSSPIHGHGYFPGVRAPFTFGHWSNLSPFLAQTKCKYSIIRRQRFKCLFGFASQFKTQRYKDLLWRGREILELLSG